MNAAIYQFKLFESSSLEYANEDGQRLGTATIGLWDKSVQYDATLASVLTDDSDPRE